MVWMRGGYFIPNPFPKHHGAQCRTAPRTGLQLVTYNWYCIAHPTINKWSSGNLLTVQTFSTVKLVQCGTTVGWHLASERAKLTPKHLPKEDDVFHNSTTRERYNAFVNNLGLMYNVLQELSKPSLQLQNQECTIIMAHKAICHYVRVRICLGAQTAQPTEPEGARGKLT